jgi:hypothetical protein
MHIRSVIHFHHHRQVHYYQMHQHHLHQQHHYHLMIQFLQDFLVLVQEQDLMVMLDHIEIQFLQMMDFYHYQILIHQVYH